MIISKEEKANALERIICNYKEAYHYYYNIIFIKKSRSNDMKFYFTFSTLIFFRSIGIDDFIRSDNILLKWSNEKKWQDFALIISDFYDCRERKFKEYANSGKITPFTSLYKIGHWIGSMKMSESLRSYKVAYYQNHKPKSNFKDKYEIENSKKNAMDGMECL